MTSKADPESIDKPPLDAKPCASEDCSNMAQLGDFCASCLGPDPAAVPLTAERAERDMWIAAELAHHYKGSAPSGVSVAYHRVAKAWRVICDVLLERRG